MITNPTVYIVDDDPAVRDALHWLITSVNLNVEIFERAQQFCDAYDPDGVGCLLLDIRMPDISGLELMRRFSEKIPNLPVIVITGHGDVETAVEVMKLGAFDFIEKPIKNQPLLEVIQQAIEKSKTLLMQRFHESTIQERYSLLTSREQEILDLLIDGKTNKLIASKLCISNKTVEAHRANLMHKMQANSLTDLIKMSMLLGQYKHDTNYKI